MDHRIVDLHVHSTESDGTLTPEDLVAEAKKVGLAAFALTDHDTCQGVCKAMPCAASAGIELIPGIELSTDYHGKEVHIVGLYIDMENEQLLKKTAEYRKCRSERNALMVEALQKEGLSITMEELVAENPDCVITRANIARFLYEHGQIKSVREAFDRYIGDHCKCYVGRLKVASTDAVRLIKEAGGTAILAHPLLYGLSNTCCLLYTSSHLIIALLSSKRENCHHRRQHQFFHVSSYLRPAFLVQTALSFHCLF